MTSIQERIEAKETPVSNLFSENFTFNIPVYQRPLSWTQDNFDELFEDLSNSIENGIEQYFLGSVLLQQTGKNVYDIVDGQQRITAITILLAVIRDLTNNSDLIKKINSYLYQEEDKYKGIPAVMRITPWEEMSDLFKNYLYVTKGTTKFLEEWGTRIRFKDLNDPRYHIYEAIKTFSDKLRSYTDMENFVKYLLTKVYIVYITTNNQTSAFRLFNVMNARGLPLNPADLLKSENLGVISDIDKREKYSEIWRDMEENIGRDELNDIIAFIRTIQRKDKAKLGIYDEFQQIFKDRLLVRGTSFIDYLKNIADVYMDKILEPSLDLNDLVEKNNYKVTIDMMRRFVPFSDWIPLLLAFHQKFNSDVHLGKFSQKLENKVIFEWTIGYSATERITSLNKIIKIIDDAKKPDDVIEKLGIPSKEDKETFLRMIDNSQIYDIYQGKLVKYLLLRLDKDFWDMENFTGYPGTVTVEHVLPQNPASDSNWMSKFNEKQRLEWTNRLGNLVLLSGRKNSRAQNFDFVRKKLVYNGERGTSFKITREMSKYSDWKVTDLKNRQQELVNLAVKIFSN